MDNVQLTDRFVVAAMRIKGTKHGEPWEHQFIFDSLEGMFQLLTLAVSLSNSNEVEKDLKSPLFGVSIDSFFLSFELKTKEEIQNGLESIKQNNQISDPKKQENAENGCNRSG